MREKEIARWLIGVFFGLMFVLPACAQKSSVDAGEASYYVFWTEFRQAVLASDSGKLASLTRFPFVVRGMLDDDPVKKYQKSDFTHLLPILLQQDPGLSETPDTMENLIRKTVKPTPKNLEPAGTSARVGVFSFKKLEGKWYFTEAYIEQ